MLLGVKFLLTCEQLSELTLCIRRIVQCGQHYFEGFGCFVITLVPLIAAYISSYPTGFSSMTHTSGQSERLLGRMIVITHTFYASIMASAYSVPPNFALLRCAKREEPPARLLLSTVQWPPHNHMQQQPLLPLRPIVQCSMA